MRKIAFFVEGQTEAIFITKLIKEICNANSYIITNIDCRGPINARTLTIVNASTQTGNESHYFLIYNSSGDGAVISDIRTRYQGLFAQSYSAIIGLRDVYPLTDAQRLRNSVSTVFQNNAILPIKIIFAVMEVESWFMAEESHYSKICSTLNHFIASQIVGFDVASKSTETLYHPADDLDRIYQRVGRAYNKKRKIVQRTIDALDYSNLYISVRNRNSSLDELLTCLETVIE